MRFPILIELRRSRFLDVALVLTTLSSSLAVIAFPREMAIQAAMLLALWLAAGLAYRGLSLRATTLRLEQGGSISLRLAGADAFASAEVLPGALVHPWLSVVRLKCADSRNCKVIVAVDSLKQEEFRRLRVFLHWRAAVSAPGDGA